ncbi:MAG: type II toxin-antitoxin system VapC family toxin [Acidimicrobiales bacterium]
MAFYLDTSALVKLVVAEAETEALREWLAAAERNPVTCELARTELMRAVRRRAPEAMVRARLVLDAVTVLEVPSPTFDRAGRVDPTSLRTLDAVHIAAALDLGDDLEGLVAYDSRLSEAAEANGIPLTSPV